MLAVAIVGHSWVVFVLFWALDVFLCTWVAGRKWASKQMFLVSFSQYSPHIYFICWYFKLLLAWQMLYYQRKEKCPKKNTTIVPCLILGDRKLGVHKSKEKKKRCFTNRNNVIFPEECYMKSTLVRNFRGLPNPARVDLDVLGWGPTVYFLLTSAWHNWMQQSFLNRAI